MMDDFGNPAPRALRAYELGSFCADFRYRFQLHAWCTEVEIDAPGIREFGLIDELM